MINKARKLSTKFIILVDKFFPKRTLKHIILKKHCYLCDTTIYEKESICKGCKNDLPFNHSCCASCAIPLPALRANKTGSTQQSRICGECFKSNPSYTQCFSAFCYTFPINALISDFKYSKQRHLGKLLSTLTSDIISLKIDQNQLIKPDKLIPVPLHSDKLSARGFNQSGDICKDLSRKLDIPIDTRCIERVLNNPAQASLSKKQRQQNLAKAFRIHKRVDGEIVALVDDVITTGVTAELLSKLLLQAGAKEVYVWSLARTPLN
ncbi:ComF family protein [Alkalimarinus alittae]|uniref:Double zinc ribbon domain-containing protein n=1 Tax=Alkalimarinus alittae TaxID=2961619 RepID=A0ABY6N4P6_9ALTE|nr:double zinc ribbon domain-containing protein [Alkalimarinus alittae]UZE97086.1 double zinc ribbon domain-containing protein [Alkalimarinus alittae]